MLFEEPESGRYTGVPYDQNAMRIKLGDTLLMEAGQPLDFDATAASKYLTDTTAVHGTVRVRLRTFLLQKCSLMCLRVLHGATAYLVPMCRVLANRNPRLASHTTKLKG